ncbi:MAG: hypothetical protein AAF850_05935 [Pseudomonadota bacterium]
MKKIAALLLACSAVVHTAQAASFCSPSKSKPTVQEQVQAVVLKPTSALSPHAAAFAYHLAIDVCTGKPDAPAPMLEGAPAALAELAAAMRTSGAAPLATAVRPINDARYIQPKAFTERHQMLRAKDEKWRAVDALSTPTGIKAHIEN